MATTKIRYNQVKTGLPTGGDSNYASTSLILNMDGADGSTSFSDESSKSHTVTAVGSAAVSTVESKFGGGSLYLNGTSDYLDIPSHVSFDFGSSDFSIEAWVYPEPTNAAYPSFLSSTTGWSAGASSLRFDNTGQSNKFTFHLNGANPGDPFLASSAQASGHNSWYHVALVRSGNTFNLFINGALEDSGTFTSSYRPDLGNLRVGLATWDGANGYYKGYVDDLRITKGVARYTSAFSVPTSEHPSFEGHTGKVIVAGEDGTMELQ